MAYANVANAQIKRKTTVLLYESEHSWALPTPTKGFPPLETDKEMIPLTPIRLRRTPPHCHSGAERSGAIESLKRNG